MRQSFGLVQPVTTGIVAAIVGFASAFAIVLQGLAGVGASPAQAASGIHILGVGAAFWGLVAGGVLLVLERRRG